MAQDDQKPDATGSETDPNTQSGSRLPPFVWIGATVLMMLLLTLWTLR